MHFNSTNIKIKHKIPNVELGIDFIFPFNLFKFPVILLKLHVLSKLITQKMPKSPFSISYVYIYIYVNFYFKSQITRNSGLAIINIYTHQTVATASETLNKKKS